MADGEPGSGGDPTSSGASGARSGDGPTGGRNGDSTAGDRNGDAVLAPTTKSSVLWGAVGGLSFLVLVQGYELLADAGVGFVAKLLVALAVTVGAGVSAHVARDRLIRLGRS